MDKTTNLPGFTAEVSLYESSGSYRSQVTRTGRGAHAIVAQFPVCVWGCRQGDQECGWDCWEWPE